MRNPIRETFELALKLNASDIHLHSDQKPILRVDGKLYPLTTESVISRELMDQTVRDLLRDDQKQELATNHQVDTSVEYDDLGVLRINIFKERGRLAMANRIIGSSVPELSQLGLPQAINQLVDVPRGLILVSGATSNGKSTTLAAIINAINKKYQKHILTIEDPIEFIFKGQKSLISQRDIGIDATTFNRAIVGAMRQDPDVILISDLRDIESIENALVAAETGHLVFATTHAPTAPDTVTRIVATFPSEKQHTIRVKMSQNLQAVVAQRLLPAKGGSGRVLACEYMMMSSRIRELILDPAKINDIATLMQGDQVTKGVMSFDSHITSLVQEGKVDSDTALEFATSRTDMKLRLSGLL
ncbi:MAG: PilT/PilU family type 4a pilus ATPase [Acidiferrobacterales bacterium]|nr:PilT/PilU family type 4a pilus ATPase [Acidiferrobacterales bacterium]